LTKRRHEEGDTAFYLKYKSLEDMLKIIIYSSQSMLGTVPMLYHIIHNDRQILFIQAAGAVIGGGGVTIHYTIQSDKPNKKFIELKRLSGEFSYVDKIGNDSMSLYVPVLELETSNFNFP
jgi:hypothetical protein